MFDAVGLFKKFTRDKDPKKKWHIGAVHLHYFQKSGVYYYYTCIIIIIIIILIKQTSMGPSCDFLIGCHFRP